MVFLGIFALGTTCTKHNQTACALRSSSTMVASSWNTSPASVDHEGLSVSGAGMTTTYEGSPGHNCFDFVGYREIQVFVCVRHNNLSTKSLSRDKRRPRYEKSSETKSAPVRLPRHSLLHGRAASQVRREQAPGTFNAFTT